MSRVMGAAVASRRSTKNWNASATRTAARIPPAMQTAIGQPCLSLSSRNVM